MFGQFLLADAGEMDGVGTTEAALAATSAVAFAAVQYHSERETLPAALDRLRDDLRENAALTALFVVTVAVLAVAPLVAFRLVEVYLAVFFGMFLGSIAYRALYGVLGPVPEPALDRV